VITEDQTEVIEFLSNPNTYGLGDRIVERIQTHGAIVFLAGSRAYKLKRAVWFEYMDFSTVEHRRKFCAAEIEINVRTAPEIYLGSRAIIRNSDGRMSFAPADQSLSGLDVVDWVVEMARFDQEALFDRLAERGVLSNALMIALTDQICAFHENAEIRNDQGGRQAHQRVIDTNHTQLEHYSGAIFDREKVEALKTASDTELENCHHEIDRRRGAGLVRHCHGDMHLRNICLFGGRPTLFDGIEFDDQIACVDVLYDLAFLLMDLIERDLTGFANLVLNHYLFTTATADYEKWCGIACLPLFLSCRAGVRAHVSAATAESCAQSGEAEIHKTRARSYLEAALLYLEPAAPHLIAVGGLSGSGKSILAGALCPQLGRAPGAIWVRSDVIRKRLAGVEPSDRLGIDNYTATMNRRVYEIMRETTARVLNCGHSVVVDAVFAHEKERLVFEEIAKKIDVNFTGIWLTAPRDTLVRRIDQRKIDNKDPSDATVGVLDRQLSYELGNMRWNVVDASGTEGETLCRAKQVIN